MRGSFQEQAVLVEKHGPRLRLLLLVVRFVVIVFAALLARGLLQGAEQSRWGAVLTDI